jgi:hypothetical protein
VIKDRVIQLIEFKNISKEKFFAKIGTTSANFRGEARKTPLNSTTIENIFSEIPDVNIEWLLTGNGEMLKKSEVSEQKNDTGNENFLKFLHEKTETLNKKIWDLEAENKHLKDELSVRKKVIGLDVDNQEYNAG